MNPGLGGESDGKTRKETTRQKILDRRRALTPGEIEKRSREIVQRFISLCPIPHEKWKGLHVGLYRTRFDELNLSRLERFLDEAGGSIYFPRIVESSKPGVMEFAERGKWKIGPFGLIEPHPDQVAIVPSRLDLIFVPGVAFGRNGERIGMGAGYYDRFLEQTPGTLLIALAFEFQVLEKLVQDPWDRPVHWIMTEESEFRSPRVQQWLEERALGAPRSL